VRPEPDNWRETFRAFRRIAAKEGLASIAGEIPADRATVYRIIGEITLRPTKAIRAGIERVVREHEGDKDT
jgi:hypothetical protein